MSRTAQLILLLSSLLFLGGCEGTPSDSISNTIEGTYRLAQVGNQDLPATITSGGTLTTFLEGTLVLESSLDFELTNRFTFLGNEEIDAVSGTWTYIDGTLTLRNQSGSVIYPENDVDGSTITLHSTFGGPNGVALVLRYEAQGL